MPMSSVVTPPLNQFGFERPYRQHTRTNPIEHGEGVDPIPRTVGAVLTRLVSGMDTELNLPLLKKEEVPVEFTSSLTIPHIEASKEIHEKEDKGEYEPIEAV